jgi:transketolase
MTSKLDLATLKPMANAIRALSMDAVQRANSGHPGMPMGMADVATVLWSRHLKFDPADVTWPDRDRFVLSAGHGSMLIYSLLHLAGVKEVTIEDLKNFRQMDSKTAGHPEYGHCPGVETTTGPLGQGISTAVGMALAERLLNARYGDTLVDHRTWVIEIAATREAIGWSHEPFEIPEEVTTNWRTMCQASAEMRSEWRDRLQVSDEREAFNAQISGKLPDSARDALEAYARQMAEEKPVLASRAASGNTIAAICEAYPGLVGGSADLTGSNLTKAKSQTPVSAEDFSGSYIHYGIREHGMAAAMNGMSLHGGIRPYGGTFLIFSDYCRPAIRLSGLMNQPVVYVFTHDSIGLGEDGPTHQPVEHLSALRAMPNVETFRPCDAVETAEAWACALERTDGPTTLALSRQKLVHARQDDASENLSARGGYLAPPRRPRRFTSTSTLRPRPSSTKRSSASDRLSRRYERGAFPTRSR